MSETSNFLPNTDTRVFLLAYFEMEEGKVDDFKAVAKIASDKVRENEEGCLSFGFVFSQDSPTAFFRESYVDGDAVLTHLKVAEDVLPQFFACSKLKSIEVHGPAEEIEKAREPLTKMGATFWSLDQDLSFSK
eukprot:m.34446 g.34446  ORF g.34446 m.34446 type:complete len:133 (-) comp9917_c0_seq1:239-637(-)